MAVRGASLADQREHHDLLELLTTWKSPNCGHVCPYPLVAGLPPDVVGTTMVPGRRRAGETAGEIVSIDRHQAGVLRALSARDESTPHGDARVEEIRDGDRPDA